MPYVMAFKEITYSSPFFVAETIIDILFFIDIIVTLNSAYYLPDSTLQVNRLEIFLNYLKGMMIIDIIAVFPFYLLTEG